MNASPIGSGSAMAAIWQACEKDGLMNDKRRTRTMSNNSNLHRARKARNDEFFT